MYNMFPDCVTQTNNYFSIAEKYMLEKTVEFAMTFKCVMSSLIDTAIDN